MLLDPMFSPSASIDAVNPTLGVKEGRETRLRRRENFRTIKAKEERPDMVEVEHIMRIHGHEVTVKSMKQRPAPKRRETIQEIFKRSKKKTRARRRGKSTDGQPLSGVQMSLEHRRSATPLAMVVPSPIRVSTPPGEIGLVEDSTEFKVVREHRTM